MVKPDNYREVPTPCYIVDEKLLRHNLEILRHVCDETGCKILLAQKAFSMYYEYPLIGRYLNGATASGLYEAKLAYEELCCKEITDISGNLKHCENHIFSPAYPEKDMDEILQICDHLVFNSFTQWEKNKDKALEVLRSRLLAQKQKEQQDAINANRAGQVGTGDRSEKIRTYNFPQDRCTDHRIGLTVHNLDKIMDGNLDEIIDALATHEQAEKLRQLNAQAE